MLTFSDCSGSLELANRSIISGSVRLVYSILYSLFLGFGQYITSSNSALADRPYHPAGLSIGSEVYQRVTSLSVSTDYQCLSLRVDAPWYRATIDQHWCKLVIRLSERVSNPSYLAQSSSRSHAVSGSLCQSHESVIYSTDHIVFPATRPPNVVAPQRPTPLEERDHHHDLDRERRVRLLTSSYRPSGQLIRSTATWRTSTQDGPL